MHTPTVTAAEATSGTTRPWQELQILKVIRWQQQQRQQQQRQQQQPQEKASFIFKFEQNKNEEDLTPVVNFINLKSTNFLYENPFRQLLLRTCN